MPGPVAAVLAIAGAVKAAADAVAAAVKVTEDLTDRSVILEVRNATSQPLAIHKSATFHGEFGSMPPPATIPPMTPALMTTDNEVFTEGTSGRLRYRVDDEGTLFYVRWDVPQLGGNEGEARLEGPHADFFATHHVTPGGNHNVHMEFVFAERTLTTPSEQGWQTCGECKAMFFAPNAAESKCPGAPIGSPIIMADGRRMAALGYGPHQAAGWMFHLPHTVQGPHRESEWRRCRHCPLLFFDGW
jgi:hypothetical protein